MEPEVGDHEKGEIYGWEDGPRNQRNVRKMVKVLPLVLVL